MACVVCKLGDDCGPMQRTDCCDQPFHWNSSCARALGIRARRGGPTGDLRCAPRCTPCEPEDTGDDWQVSLFDKIMAEREANERLKREDPPRSRPRCARSSPRPSAASPPSSTAAA